MCTVDSGSMKPRQSHKTVWCTCFSISMTFISICRLRFGSRLTTFVFLMFFCWYFSKIVWWFYLNEISNYCVFASLLFIPTSRFINFGGDFCQPPRLLHRSRLLFWPKFTSLPVYSVLAFYFKLESTNNRSSKFLVSTYGIDDTMVQQKKE